MNLQVSGLKFFILLLQFDFFTQAIIILLFIFSILSWAIIIEKIFKFELYQIKSLKFEKLFWSGDALEDIYERIKNLQKTPNCMVFAAAMQEWLSSNVQEIIKGTSASKRDMLRERIYDSMVVAGKRSMKKMKSGLLFLLISSTTSTLFGLMGTVWGLTQSFQTISFMKEANLTSIAPSIGSALIVTLIGIICTIPSLIGYYIISSKINYYEEELDNFSLEILTVLSREL